jgi:hypothetical protein
MLIGWSGFYPGFKKKQGRIIKYFYDNPPPVKQYQVKRLPEN